MNVAGWRQRAMTARLRGKSFLSLSLSPWTADSELAGFFLLIAKITHHKGAVIITPNHSITAEGEGESPSKRK